MNDPTWPFRIALEARGLVVGFVLRDRVWQIRERGGERRVVARARSQQGIARAARDLMKRGRIAAL